jgi:WD40 repeat protein
VVDLDSRRIVRQLTGHPRLYYLDISPDGRFVATGTQHGRDVKVWNVATGDLVKTIPCGSANVAFSPDGSTLVVAGSSEYTFWKTSGWTNPRRVARTLGGDLAGFVAFDSGGKLVALTTGPRTVVLAEAVSLEPLSTFTLSDTAIISSLALSDDARHLAAGMENGLVHVWNLDLVEQQLAGLGLGRMPPIEFQLNSLLSDPKSVRIRARIARNLYLLIPSF